MNRPLAITVAQPWATLIAIGAKRIETRSWPITPGGELWIHAAKTIPTEGGLRCLEPGAIRTALAGAGFTSPADLPRSALVARVRVSGCAQILYHQDGHALPPLLAERMVAGDAAFGDFRAGRWGWLLDDLARVDPPVAPVSGRQGLWHPSHEDLALALERLTPLPAS